MASLKTKMTGDLGAQREATASSFYGRKVKNAGKGPGMSPFSPMGKVQLAQTDAQKGSLPSGGNTVGGVVNGLYDKGNYQGRKAGEKLMAKMSNEHALEFNKDPMTDRGAEIAEMKGFKDSKYPKNPFGSKKPQTATDEFYSPFKGREPR